MRTLEAADMGGLERHHEGDQIVNLFLRQHIWVLMGHGKAPLPIKTERIRINNRFPEILNIRQPVDPLASDLIHASERWSPLRLGAIDAVTGRTRNVVRHLVDRLIEEILAIDDVTDSFRRFTLIVRDGSCCRSSCQRRCG